ncbi:hypothetical protein L6164_008725 [Bauhinia variegata]|uniref:Uncharacterized protein n=1 Tax=Bauhinia variegata TaxID=167791 RepID=A0ACB9PKF1_BAUVA|nr:hypothetical protein L6164_008725 [Bauhinia variegata]
MHGLETKFQLATPKISCNSNKTLCMASTNVLNDAIVRRSANYQKPVWNDDYIQSLSNAYVDKSLEKRHDELKREVRMMFDKVMNPLDQLELIDILQGLGLAYHFEDQIKRTSESLYYNINNGAENIWCCDNLYATALAFRLLRQHRYHVSSDCFKNFQDNMGNFKATNIENIEGLLSLYEASYLSIEGETLLDEAKCFASKHLKEFVKNEGCDASMVKKIIHSLEIPLHWRLPILEARWFMDIYSKSSKMNPLLLELAKLNFNKVQAIYQDDLKLASRWWSNIGLGEKFSFARSRLVESFLWNVGVASEPHLRYFRRMSAALYQLITMVDDVYDVYGTIEELEHFTNAMERWDTNALENLPNYMKMCFLAAYNYVNEIAFDVLKEKGFYIIPYLKKGWVDLCKAYMKEAKWYHSGYKPSFDEYLENGWVSIGGPNVLIHNYFMGANPIKMEELTCFEQDYPNIVYLSQMIFRLTGDLGTCSREIRVGDVPKSIECYMNEKGVSESEAKEHVRSLIDLTWKKMNEDILTSSSFPHSFKEVAMNVARMSLWMYQFADGHTDQDPVTKDRIASLLIEPVL